MQVRDLLPPAPTKDPLDDILIYSGPIMSIGISITIWLFSRYSPNAPSSNSLSCSGLYILPPIITGYLAVHITRINTGKVLRTPTVFGLCYDCRPVICALHITPEITGYLESWKP